MEITTEERKPKKAKKVFGLRIEVWSKRELRYPRELGEESTSSVIWSCWNGHFRAQLFTSLMADLRQDINRVSSFNKCLN